MPMIIGSLWQRFYQNGIYASIPNKVNDKTFGIYSDYESDVNSEYSVTVACEVNSAESMPKDVAVAKIPSGKYAKFVVKGHIQKAVAEFWEKFWQMELDRSYKCDFEEYQNGNIENAEIHIYISLNNEK
jgi:predicted transcriptional regulator YdeE